MRPFYRFRRNPDTLALEVHANGEKLGEVSSNGHGMFTSKVEGGFLYFQGWEGILPKVSVVNSQEEATQSGKDLEAADLLWFYRLVGPAKPVAGVTS